VPLHVDATQALGHKLTAVWAITEEIVSNAVGGAFEATNPLLTGLWTGSREDLAYGLSVELNTSNLPSSEAFRLYVFVREDPASLGNRTFPLHEASATLPFHICHTARPTEACHEHVEYARRIGIRADRGAYPGVTPASSFEEVQMSLFMKGDRTCSMPCGLEQYCHTATRWEQCYDHVKWALKKGIDRYPDLYPGLTNMSTFEDVQMSLYRKSNGLCTRPCPAGPLEDYRDVRPDMPNQDQTTSGSQRPAVLAPFLALLLAMLAAVAGVDP